jgi:hypothetical protein
VQIGQDESWFGVSHDLLNLSGHHWTEFGSEFGVSGETALGGGTLFSEVSGIYTRSSGDHASGTTAGLSEEEATTLELAHIGWRASDDSRALKTIR